jgi:hypothetical protein
MRGKHSAPGRCFAPPRSDFRLPAGGPGPTLGSVNLACYLGRQSAPTAAARSAPRGASFALVGLLALAACVGGSAVEPPPHAVREVVELASWQVLVDGARFGTVRQLEIRDPTGPLRFFRVEDRDGRWLGHATAEGRFARRVPFAEQEEDLGVWPLARGVGLLLGLDKVVLEPIVAAPPK